MKLSILLISILTLLLFSESQTKIEELLKLKANANRYTFFPIETFDSATVWEVFHKHVYLSSLQLTRKVPAGDLFETEKSLFQSGSSDFSKSLQLHGNIEIPGRDKISIRNIEKKFFPPGRPVLISLWIHSNNYPLKLKAILSQRNTKDLAIDLGELNFHGWKRIEAKVSLVKKPDRLNLSKSEEFSLGALVFESGLRMPKDFVIHIDQISMVIEKYSEYPGSEIPDAWYIE